MTKKELNRNVQENNVVESTDNKALRRRLIQKNTDRSNK